MGPRHPSHNLVAKSYDHTLNGVIETRLCSKMQLLCFCEEILGMIAHFIVQNVVKFDLIPRLKYVFYGLRGTIVKD